MSLQAEARATSIEDLSSDQADITPRSSSRPTDADPIRAALARARLRPPMPEEERQRMLALAAEAKGPWHSTEEILAHLDTMKPQG